MSVIRWWQVIHSIICIIIPSHHHNIIISILLLRQMCKRYLALTLCTAHSEPVIAGVAGKTWLLSTSFMDLFRSFVKPFREKLCNRVKWDIIIIIIFVIQIMQPRGRNWLHFGIFSLHPHWVVVVVTSRSLPRDYRLLSRAHYSIPREIMYTMLFCCCSFPPVIFSFNTVSNLIPRFFHLRNVPSISSARS